MKNISLRKVSILGLVLLATSAVTAAILPDNASKTKVAEGDDNGSLRADFTNDGVTCVPGEGLSCNITVGTTSTFHGEVNQGDSFTGAGNGIQTLTNTSQSGIGSHPASSAMPA